MYDPNEPANYDTRDCGPNEIWSKPIEGPQRKPKIITWPKAEIYIVLITIGAAFLLYLALTAYPFVQ